VRPSESFTTSTIPRWMLQLQSCGSAAQRHSQHDFLTIPIRCFSEMEKTAERRSKPQGPSPGPVVDAQQPASGPMPDEPAVFGDPLPYLRSRNHSFAAQIYGYSTSSPSTWFVKRL
jgi:hypothetical protein